MQLDDMGLFVGLGWGYVEFCDVTRFTQVATIRLSEILKICERKPFGLTRSALEVSI